jgi:glycosyltransferase involved in cell wall biosynthesis
MGQSRRDNPDRLFTAADFRRLTRQAAMTPLVSILIPAYNAERWITDTIQSALGQTWPRKEIIVVDDGSRDQTLRVARQFASKNVSVVTQENQGASAARNRAFELCQGDYIQWLDADDLLSPDKVAKQMAVAEECHDTRWLLSSGWGYFMYRPSRAQFLPTPLWCDLSPVEWLLRKMGQNLHMQTGTWLVSQELTQAAGPWDTRLSLDDDGEYFCRVVLASDAIQFVPDGKVFYRQSDFDRLSGIDRSDKKLESQFLSMKLHVGYLRSLEESERVRAACLAYLQTWFGWFFEERPDLAQELGRLAATLGGRLQAPKLPWKYLWIQKLFGWSAAKEVRQRWNRCKSSVMRCWDKALLHLEDRNFAVRPGNCRGKFSKAA